MFNIAEWVTQLIINLINKLATCISDIYNHYNESLHA